MRRLISSDINDNFGELDTESMSFVLDKPLTDGIYYCILSNDNLEYATVFMLTVDHKAGKSVLSCVIKDYDDKLGCIQYVYDESRIYLLDIAGEMSDETHTGDVIKMTKIDD